jgi:hypothetical protein
MVGANGGSCRFGGAATAAQLSAEAVRIAVLDTLETVFGAEGQKSKDVNSGEDTLLSIPLESLDTKLQVCSLISYSPNYTPQAHLLTEVPSQQILRQYQLSTGKMIPDPVINESKNGHDLVQKLIGSINKPKKVHERIEAGNVLDGLANVSFSAQRLTRLQKEKQIGRWKHIEERMLAMNLPLPKERQRELERELPEESRQEQREQLAGHV